MRQNNITKWKYDSSLNCLTHISISPYNDSIYDAITNHKLSVLIMDEKLENRKNEEITVDNALQYLYYDFER
mgnify:CR=1 FL=1